MRFSFTTIIHIYSKIRVSFVLFGELWVSNTCSIVRATGAIYMYTYTHVPFVLFRQLIGCQNLLLLSLVNDVRA